MTVTLTVSDGRGGESSDGVRVELEEDGDSGGELYVLTIEGSVFRMESG